MKTSISFLKSNYNFKDTIDLISKSNADYIHVDVMDGLFVGNKTNFTKDMLEYLKKTSKNKDVHLMTLNLENYIDVFSYINPEFITFHYEAVDNVDEIINYIKSKNIKVGIAINPLTDIEVLKPYLKKVDLVLVMSVLTGYGGQKFIESSYSKVEKLNKLRVKKNYNYVINIDGGINDSLIPFLKEKGLDIAVAGSYVCCSSDFNERIDKLK